MTFALRDFLELVRRGKDDCRENPRHLLSHLDIYFVDYPSDSLSFLEGFLSRHRYFVVDRPSVVTPYYCPWS